MKIISNMVEVHVFRFRKKQIEFLLLKRSEKEIYPGLWQMVSGTIHNGETAYQTALREIAEETGLKPIKFWVVPNINSFYSPERNYISLLPVFAVQVKVTDKVKISDEHVEFGWFKKPKAKKMLAWAGQRKSVDIISEYFTKDRSYLNFVEIKI